MSPFQMQSGVQGDDLRAASVIAQDVDSAVGLGKGAGAVDRQAEQGPQNGAVDHVVGDDKESLTGMGGGQGRERRRGAETDLFERFALGIGHGTGVGHEGTEPLGLGGLDLVPGQALPAADVRLDERGDGDRLPSVRRRDDLGGLQSTEQRTGIGRREEQSA